MELIRAIRESEVGTVIAIRSSDRGSRIDIPKWIEKAGHRLIGVEEAFGYDEIVVEKLH
jgi:TusA-related sulfurtransferase